MDTVRNVQLTRHLIQQGRSVRKRHVSQGRLSKWVDLVRNVQIIKFHLPIRRSVSSKYATHQKRSPKQMADVKSVDLTRYLIKLERSVLKRCVVRERLWKLIWLVRSVLITLLLLLMERDVRKQNAKMEKNQTKMEFAKANKFYQLNAWFSEANLTIKCALMVKENKERPLQFMDAMKKTSTRLWNTIQVRTNSSSTSRKHVSH